MPRRRVDVNDYDRVRDGQPEHVRDYTREQEVRGDVGAAPAMLPLRRPRAPPGPRISREDLTEAQRAAQAAGEQMFRDLGAGRPNYVVKDDFTGQVVGTMVDTVGFAHVHFKGTRNKNMLEAMGMHVYHDYPSGFQVSVDVHAPDWARSVPYVDATFMQSININEAANRAWLAEMQKRGFLKDAYVTSRMD